MRKFSPAFIGIGAPHAGLGSMVNWLEAHPAIADSVAPINFFNTDSYTKRGVEWYEAQLKNRHEKPELLRGDCSPGYLLAPLAPERIVENYPTTKLFVILRNPIYRALAEYEAMKTIDVRATKMSAVEYLNSVSSVLEHGAYAAALERYFAYYSPLQLHILIYEEIATAPLAQVQKLYEFLEVDKNFVPPTLISYAEPPEPPKNPGIIKRNIFRLKMLYRSFRVKPPQPVFPDDTRLKTLLTTEEWEYYTALLLPQVDRLSHIMSRDMSYVWGLRDEV